MQNDSSKKVDLSTKTCLVIDTGLFSSLAQKLAESFKKVYYFSESVATYPTINPAFIGMGLPHVERVKQWMGLIDKIDLFVFPTTHYSETQIYLESIGKRVWGSRNGDELELDREVCKELMVDLGLPVGPYEIVKGTAALREYLKANKDVWVKISDYRGSFESFNSPDYQMIESRLDRIEESFGPNKTEIEFLCEDSLPDMTEIGYDGYVIDGQYPSAQICGIEVKDMGYISEFRKYADLPPELTKFNDAIAPELKKYGYRGFMSTEIRCGKNKIPYMIDFTARMPLPPGDLQQEMYTNLVEIMWFGADGILIDPIPAAKYGVEVIIKSDLAEKHFQQVNYPKSIRQWVKLFNQERVQGRNIVIPQFPVGMAEVGAVLGIGDTLDDALAMVKENADQIKGDGIRIKMDAMDDAEKELRKSEEFGIRIFS